MISGHSMFRGGSALLDAALNVSCLLLTSEYASGKTYAAELFSCASLRDVVRCCCLVGGDNPTMQTKSAKPCHNYLPTLDLYWDDGNMSSLIHDRDLRYVLDAEFRAGAFAHFDNGAFVSCAKTGDSGIGKMIPDVEIHGFDDLGDPCVEDPTFVLVRNKKIPEGDVGRWTSYVRFEFLANSTPIQFDGFPLIRIMESAVAAPQRAIYPVYLSKEEITLMSKLKQRWQDTCAKQLATLLEESAELRDLITTNKLDQKSKKLSIVDLVLRFTKTSVVSKRKEMAELESQYLAIEENIRILQDITRRNTINSEITKDPIGITQYDDLIIYPDGFGEYITRVIPILSVLFRTGRCFIDSITGLVSTMSGNAISGGLSGGFIEAMQRCNESEAILLYTPMASDMANVDPMLKWDAGGSVNGFIVVDTNEGYLSDANWYCTSRARKAIHRSYLYKLVDQNSGLVFTLNGVYNFRSDGPGVIEPYSKYGLEGPYDQKLRLDPKGQRMFVLSSKASEKILIYDKPNLKGQQKGPLTKMLQVSSLERNKI